jgi:hypothetical protein
LIEMTLPAKKLLKDAPKPTGLFFPVPEPGLEALAAEAEALVTGTPILVNERTREDGRTNLPVETLCCF